MKKQNTPAITPEEAKGTASFDGLKSEKQETFLDRLKKEESDLAEKCDKLTAFIRSENFAKVDPAQSRLLKQQIGHMRSYHGVLQERIKQLA